MTKRRNTRNAPQPLADLVPGLLTPVCRRRGFATTALMAAGVDLFGERLCQTTRVERIVWPRGSRIDDAQSTGATLVVSTDPGGALTLQHVAPQIVERANTIIGWGAIERLKITQTRRAPAERRSRPPLPPDTPPSDPADLKRHEAALCGITHQDLKTALARLALGIERRSSASGRKRP